MQSLATVTAIKSTGGEASDPAAPADKVDVVSEDKSDSDDDNDGFNAEEKRMLKRLKKYPWTLGTLSVYKLALLVLWPKEELGEVMEMNPSSVEHLRRACKAEIQMHRPGRRDPSDLKIPLPSDLGPVARQVKRWMRLRVYSADGMNRDLPDVDVVGICATVPPDTFAAWFTGDESLDCEQGKAALADLQKICRIHVVGREMELGDRGPDGTLVLSS
jgi:hypothetical protein